jgi:hypothetical protein
MRCTYGAGRDIHPVEFLSSQVGSPLEDSTGRRTQPPARRAYAPEGDDIIFFVCRDTSPPLQATLGRRADDSKRKPSALSGKRGPFFKLRSTFCPYHCLAEQCYFCLSLPVPHSDAGSPLRGVGSPSRRPMGKKEKLSVTAPAAP